MCEVGIVVAGLGRRIRMTMMEFCVLMLPLLRVGLRLGCVSKLGVC